jgi:hypothetical protein
MGEVLAFGGELSLIYLFISCFHFLGSALIHFNYLAYLRYLVYLNGLVTTRSHQNYGYYHISCHFIQVLLSFS